MFSCIGKKKPSKRFQAVSTKVKEYYKTFHSINSELKEITEHKAAITDPNQYKRWILNDFKLFHKQITYIIETVNKVEDKYGLKRLEFDVERVWPRKSTKSSWLLEISLQIGSFLQN